MLDEKYGNNNNNNNNNTSCRQPGHTEEENVKVNLQDMWCRRLDWTKMTQGTAHWWEHDNELWLPLRVINFVAS